MAVVRPLLEVLRQPLVVADAYSTKVEVLEFGEIDRAPLYHSQKRPEGAEHVVPLLHDSLQFGARSVGVRTLKRSGETRCLYLAQVLGDESHGFSGCGRGDGEIRDAVAQSTKAIGEDEVEKGFFALDVGEHRT